MHMVVLLFFGDFKTYCGRIIAVQRLGPSIFIYLDYWGEYGVYELKKKAVQKGTAFERICVVFLFYCLVNGLMILPFWVWIVIK